MTPQRRNALTAAIAAIVVVGMTGLAFAAVPLYQAFCRITGYGGTTSVAERASQRVLDRTINVRFDTNVASDLPVEFTPAAAETLRLGETGVAIYHVKNLSNAPVTAVAAYNVTPHKTGVYFKKLECFCFQSHTLQPGESADLPVVFYVDPDLASDPETREVDTVTLSYTFFRTQEEAAAALPQQP